MVKKRNARGETSKDSVCARVGREETKRETAKEKRLEIIEL